MPHLRIRHGLEPIRKLSKLWPVVGMIGLRQAGKTTLFEKLLGISNMLSLDDLGVRNEAMNSPRSFLARIDKPVVLDEIQKAPELFDAIKLDVDRKRVPGTYYVTGSSTFSAKIGIRESLTGRIGILELLPLTLAEALRLPFSPLSTFTSPLKDGASPRLSIEQLSPSLSRGGMPVPAFLRDQEQRRIYWKGWLDAAIHRDLPRFFNRGFDPDFAFSLMLRMGALLADGELPTLKHFAEPARKVRIYLGAMEEIFLLRRIPCHELGTGKEVWIFSDSGLAAHALEEAARSLHGEGATLSLARHLLWNEWSAQFEYQLKRMRRTYYKSAQGSPVDAIFDGIPFRIAPSVTAVTRQLKWEERAVAGAMKKLGAKTGYLVAPVDRAHLPGKRGGVGILPWGSWS